MECICIVSYSILINRELKGLINPSRGIRQGDPLSHFLFLLCTEGLHGLIIQAARSKEINGFSLCKRGPKLTNDSLLFCRGTFQECDNALKIFSNYKATSVQKINREKTALFFSKSSQEENRRR
ncbi:hypothetical protein ACB092_04G186900 [Castanea dentata]